MTSKNIQSFKKTAHPNTQKGPLSEPFFERFYKFSGRSSRSMYWTTAFLSGAVFIFFLLLMHSAAKSGGNPEILFFMVGLTFCYINVCNSVRRVHDLGYSGWLYFGIIVGVSFFAALTRDSGFGEALMMVFQLVNFVILGFVSGDNFKNKYGPPVSPTVINRNVASTPSNLQQA